MVAIIMRTKDDINQPIDFNRAKIVSTYNDLEREQGRSADLTVRLARRLQTTLDTKKLIEIYSEELKNLVDFEQFTFHDEDQLTFKLGARAGVHSCQFNLKLDNTELGSIKLSRKERFMEEEMAIVERLAGTLVFPLNNAKLYRTALQSALRDELTGLGNKRALHADLHREADRALRHNTPLSAIVIDADHFKDINDTYGHLAGDQILKSLAKILKNGARRSDLCFRFGGEEFLVLLDNTDQAHAKKVAERLRSAIEKQNFYVGAQRIPVTVSLGCSTYQPGEQLESFIAKADKALYKAKEAGRNQTIAFDDIEPPTLSNPLNEQSA